MSIEQCDEDKIVYINSPDTLYKLADFYRKTNKQKAIYYFNKLLLSNPTRHKCHLQLAEIYEASNMTAKAITHFEYALNGKESKNIKITITKKLIELYIQKQNFNNALTLLKKRLMLFGDLGPIATLKNTIKRRIFKNEYQKEYERVLFTIAYILREKDNHKSAIKYAKKLLATSKKYNNTSLAYLHLIATIYECKKDFKKADGYFKTLKTTQPTHDSLAHTYEIIYQKIKSSGLC